MNVSIREAISQLKTANKAVNSDSRLTNKFLYSLISKHRDYLIKETQNKFKLLRLNYLFQPYRCVNLISVSKADDCCTGIKGDCRIYRTKKKLPALMLASDGPIIRRVTSIDGGMEIFEITPMEWNRKQEDTNSKYDKNFYYFWDSGYLYFPNLHWKKIHIEAFFIQKVKDIDCDEDCKDDEVDCESFLDQEFRIPQDLLARCIDAANIELLQYYHRTLPDDNQMDKNNARKN